MKSYRTIDHYRRQAVDFYFLFYGLMISTILTFKGFFSIGNGWIRSHLTNLLEFWCQEMSEGNQFVFTQATHTMGWPLYFPYIMHAIGIKNGQEMFIIAQSFMGWVCVCVYPFFVYKITSSYIAAVLSPFILHFTFGDLLYINKCGEYYGASWILALGIPLILMLMKSVGDNRRFYVNCGILSLVLMIGNIWRKHSGIVILVISLVMIVFQLHRKKICLKAALIGMGFLLTSYPMLESIVPSIVAQEWGIEGRSSQNSSPWHTFLTGLGYIENDYGLTYNDDSTRAYIENKYPGTEYLSNDYYDKCKQEFMIIAKNDPGFVVCCMANKYVDSVKLQIDYIRGKSPLSEGYKLEIFYAVICMLVIMFAMRVKPIEYRGCIGKSILILFISQLSLYPAIIAIPTEYYLCGAIEACGIMIAFFAIEAITLYEKKIVDVVNSYTVFPKMSDKCERAICFDFGEISMNKVCDIKELLCRFPKQRPEIDQHYKKAFYEYYTDNRKANTKITSLSSKLEGWMHKKIAKTRKAFGNGVSTLDIGAGTLNQLLYETVYDGDKYDVVEPNLEWVNTSKNKKYVNKIFEDINNVPMNHKYERIVSCATFEHLIDLPQVVAKAGLILRDGGGTISCSTE